jgi:hypothetical protein
MWCAGMECIDLAQDKDTWRALINVVKKTFGFHKIFGTFWLVEDLLASQEGLCFMKLVLLPLKSFYKGKYFELLYSYNVTHF